MVVENIPNSPQEYLELLVNTSLKGNFPSVEPTDTTRQIRCLYKTADGRKCAFGLLIPDKKYDDKYENHSIQEILEYDKTLLPTWASLTQLEEIQSIHDGEAIGRRNSTWRHDEFVAELMGCDLFKDCKLPEGQTNENLLCSSLGDQSRS